MKRFFKTYLAVVCVGALSACSTSYNPSAAVEADAAYPPSMTAANKQMALDFYRDGITIAERDAMIHPGYVQHNPAANKFAGKKGITAKQAFPLWMEIVTGGPAEGAAVRTGPQPPARQQAYMAIAEGDKVFLMHQRFAQDPNEPVGTFYEYFSWGMFGFKDGLIYEHWDGNRIQLESPSR